MITLTTPIAIPNLVKARLRAPNFDDDNSIATFLVQVGANSGLIYGGAWQIVIVNGACQGLRAKGAPTSFSDFVETFISTYATGYTDVLNTFVSTAGTLATKLKAVETLLAGLATPLLPPGAVT